MKFKDSFYYWEAKVTRLATGEGTEREISIGIIAKAADEAKKDGGQAATRFSGHG